MLAALGEERSASVGDILYRIGDRRYPFIAILDGDVTIVDAAGKEIVRHGPSGFLGEMNLLSGQTVADRGCRVAGADSMRGDEGVHPRLPAMMAGNLRFDPRRRPEGS
jgi:hypothetical protein